MNMISLDLHPSELKLLLKLVEDAYYEYKGLQFPECHDSYILDNDSYSNFSFRYVYT